MTTVPPPKVDKTYDPEITEHLVTKARLLVAAPDGAFSAPDMRAVDLAIRLVAPGPKACAVSASECHEITEAVIAAYDRDTFPIKAHKIITALIDQLEAADSEARKYNKIYELRSRLERSDATLAAAGAPMDEMLTDQGAEWVRCELAAITLQLDAAQTELRNMTSLCGKAQHDRDFFRAQAEERGMELREALLKAEMLRALTEQNNKVLEKIIGRPAVAREDAAAASPVPAAASPVPAAASEGQERGMKKLGRLQQEVYETLKRHGSWPHPSCWLWGTASGTQRVMDSLVRAGYATSTEGHGGSKILYHPISEIKAVHNTDRDQIIDLRDTLLTKGALGTLSVLDQNLFRDCDIALGVVRCESKTREEARVRILRELHSRP